MKEHGDGDGDVEVHVRENPQGQCYRQCRFHPTGTYCLLIGMFSKLF